MHTQRENGNVQMIMIMDMTKISPDMKLLQTVSLSLPSLAALIFLSALFFPSLPSSMLIIGVNSSEGLIPSDCSDDEMVELLKLVLNQSMVLALKEQLLSYNNLNDILKQFRHSTIQ